MDVEKSNREKPFIIGIDPGDVFNGWVLMNDVGVILESGTVSPVEMEELAMRIRSGHPRILVVEEFRLYAGRAPFKNHDTLRIVEVIGALKYQVRMTAALGVPVAIEMIPPSMSVPFFRHRDVPKLPRHELSAWKVAEWYRLFRYSQHPLALTTN
jgi:hypothetical protein